jgi:hypothetical protein
MYAEIDVRGKAAPESNWATSQIYSNRDRCAQKRLCPFRVKAHLSGMSVFDGTKRTWREV